MGVWMEFLFSAEKGGDGSWYIPFAFVLINSSIFMGFCVMVYTVMLH